MRLSKISCYILVLGAFIGQVVTVNIGVIHLSMYRVGVLLCVSLMGLIFFVAPSSSINILKRWHGLKLEQKYVLFFFFFWLTWAVLSFLWCFDIWGWVRGVFIVASAFFSVLSMINYLTDKKALKLFLSIILCVQLCCNVIAWYEISSGVYLLPLPSLDSIYRLHGLPRAWFVNVNNLSTFLVAGFFLELGVLTCSRKIWLKVILFFLMVSSLLLCLQGESRANLLGVALGLGAYLFLFLIKKHRAFKSVFIVFAVLSAGLLVMWFMGLSDTFHFESVGSSDNIRWQLIKNGLHFSAETYGFGVGAGNIEYWMRNFAVFDTNGIINVHNLWLEILVNYGVVIFTLFLIHYIWLLKVLYVRYMKSTNDDVVFLSGAFFAFLCAFTIASVSSSSILPAEWLWVLWGGIVSTFSTLSDSKISLNR